MDIIEAWCILGCDPRQVEKILLNTTICNKLKAVDELILHAKKISVKAMVANHPDKGGDSAKFIKVKEAVNFIEKALKDYRVKIEKKIKEKEELDSKKTMIKIM